MGREEGQGQVCQIREPEGRCEGTEWDRPYVIDLESANGTLVNGDAIPQSRFVELKDGDMIMFGHSTREYVLMLPSGS